MTTSLLASLRSAYHVRPNRYQDQRIKIDDENQHDKPGYHCTMEVEILDDKHFLLDMQNLPAHPNVMAALHDLGAVITTEQHKTHAHMELEIRQVSAIRALGNRISRARSQRDDATRHIWPWVCPRTGDSPPLGRRPDVLPQEEKPARCLGGDHQSQLSNEQLRSQIPANAPGPCKNS